MCRFAPPDGAKNLEISSFASYLLCAIFKMKSIELIFSFYGQYGMSDHTNLQIIINQCLDTDLQKISVWSDKFSLYQLNGMISRCPIITQNSQIHWSMYAKF